MTETTKPNEAGSPSSAEPAAGTADAFAEQRFEAIANEAMAEGGPGPDAGPPPKPGEAWLPMMQPAVDIFAANAPNWTIPKETRQQFAQALAECADQLMPGGLGNMEKWGPWAKLVFAAGMVVLPNIDYDAGRIKPLHPEPVPTDDKEDAPDGA